MEHKNRCLSSFSSSSTLFLLLLVVVFLLTALSVSTSASTFISDDIFGDRALMGRNLLQAKKSCPVNFEFLNYTIITSQCKGPSYPPCLCCAALKQFACPYSDDLNDLTNDCASTMFSYINLYGKYPPGLFASECHEGKEGLACPAASPSESPSESANAGGKEGLACLAASPSESPSPSPSGSANTSGSQLICKPSRLLVLTTGLLVLLSRFF